MEREAGGNYPREVTSGGWDRSHEVAVSAPHAPAVSAQDGPREWPAVVVTDATGIVTYWSPGAERLYGWTSDEAFGRPIYELNIDPADTAVASEIMAELVLGAGWEGQFRVHDRSGRAFEVAVVDAPLVDPSGTVVGVVGLSVPVDAPEVESSDERVAAAEARARRATADAELSMARLARLQGIARALALPGGPYEVAGVILREVAPELGGVSRALWLVDSERSFLELVDPGSHSRARSYERIPLDAALPGAEVVRSGTAIFMTTQSERDARFPALDGLGAASSSIAVLPLKQAGTVIGVLAVSYDHERGFPPAERRFFGAVADLASEALERSALRDRQAAIASALQASLLPPSLPTIDGAELAALYRPAWAGLDVGGDFYDAFPLPGGDRWAVMIGDVCGTGPAAASLTAQVRHTVRTAARTGLPIEGVVSLLNDMMVESCVDDRFCTVVLAEFTRARDGLEVSLVCGGHPNPVIRRADGTVEVVESDGMLVGAFAGVAFRTKALHLHNGDGLVLYTDGVIEARSVDSSATVDEFGIGRLCQALTTCGAPTAQGLIDVVDAAMTAFTGGAQADDVAMLAFVATEATK
ncbi:MAG: hypothetical protein NVS3B21_12480 [Acidimicrobiales bacterium]